MIKPLGRSISSSIQKLRPPNSDAVFEDFCLDLFRIILKNHKIKKYNKISPDYITYKGVSGDKQYGIDIRCKTSLAVAQCKLVNKLQPSDLEEEVTKLKEYKEDVSHYFFLISNDRVKSSLQNWVEVKNKETENRIRKNKSFPVTPDIGLPWFHILGWTEIKNHLLDNTLLCMKWGALEGLSSRYPYLQRADMGKIDNAIKTLESGNRVARCSETTSGGKSLTHQLDIEAIARIGLESKVNTTTLQSLAKFVDLFDKSYRVSQTYRSSICKIESEDLITHDEGLEQLNTISYHSARIFALTHLWQARNAAQYLVQTLEEDDFFYEESDSHDSEQGFYETFTGFLIYNFSTPQETSPPWYIDPEPINKAASRIVKEVQEFKEKGGST